MVYFCRPRDDKIPHDNLIKKVMANVIVSATHYLFANVLVNVWKIIWPGRPIAGGIKPGSAIGFGHVTY